MSGGLEGATDRDPEVIVDEGIGVIVEVTAIAGEEDFKLTVQAGDTVTAALASSAAELKLGLEGGVCNFAELTKSILAGKGRVKATETGGLWVTGGVLDGAGDVGVSTGEGLITEETILGGATVSEASMLAEEVSDGLTEGAANIVVEVIGGAVAAEVELGVDLIVIKGEDFVVDEIVVIVGGALKVVPVVTVIVDLIMLAEGSETGGESE